MRKFIVFTVCVVGFVFWFKDYVKSGQFEKFLDLHPNQQLNAKIEYYWAFALEMSGYKESALYRYRRVIKQYPETEEAALAWVAVTSILVDLRDFNVAMEECGKFLEKYPRHRKAGLVRGRIEFIGNR